MRLGETVCYAPFKIQPTNKCKNKHVNELLKHVRTDFTFFFKSWKFLSSSVLLQKDDCWMPPKFLHFVCFIHPNECSQPSYVITLNIREWTWAWDDSTSENIQHKHFENAIFHGWWNKRHLSSTPFSLFLIFPNFFFSQVLFDQFLVTLSSSLFNWRGSFYETGKII